MRVLVVAIVFPPDGVSTAQLLGEISVDLAAKGHEVHVLTTVPHYNNDRTAAAAQTLRRAGLLSYRSSLGDVQVTHVVMPRKAAGRLGRLAQWAWFHGHVIVRTAINRADSVLVVSPPPTLSVAVAIGSALRRRRVVVAIWELYPDILVALGLIRPGGVGHRLLALLERATYRVADHVVFLSEAMRATASERVDDLRDKSSVVPTFADTDELRPIARPTELRTRLGLEEKFVVGYGGNLGPEQDLTTLVDAARLLQRSDPMVHVLICGNGTDNARLRALADGMPNVTFTGHLPYEAVVEMYSTFDLSVVALAAGVSGEALPSKLYRSMSCGAPVLAIADEATTLRNLVDGSRWGWWSPAGDAAELSELLRRIRRLDLAEPRQWARTEAIERFGRRSATDAFARVLTGP